MCGRKRGFKRLFNHVNVGSGMAKRTDDLVKPYQEMRQSVMGSRPAAIAPAQATLSRSAAPSLGAARAVAANGAYPVAIPHIGLRPGGGTLLGPHQRGTYNWPA